METRKTELSSSHPEQMLVSVRMFFFCAAHMMCRVVCWTCGLFMHP